MTQARTPEHDAPTSRWRWLNPTGRWRPVASVVLPTAAALIFLIAPGLPRDIGTSEGDVFKGDVPDPPPFNTPSYAPFLSFVSIAAATDDVIVVTIGVAGPKHLFTESDFDDVRWDLAGTGGRRLYREDGYVGQSITIRAPDREAWEAMLPVLGLEPDRERNISKTIGRSGSRWAFRATLADLPPVVHHATDVLAIADTDLRHQIRLTAPATFDDHNATRAGDGALVWEIDPVRGATHALVARNERDSLLPRGFVILGGVAFMVLNLLWYTYISQHEDAFRG